MFSLASPTLGREKICGDFIGRIFSLKTACGGAAIYRRVLKVENYNTVQ